MLGSLGLGFRSLDLRASESFSSDVAFRGLLFRVQVPRRIFQKDFSA